MWVLHMDPVTRLFHFTGKFLRSRYNGSSTWFLFIMKFMDIARLSISKFSAQKER